MVVRLGLGKGDVKEVATAMYHHFASGRRRIYKRKTPYVEAIQWTGTNVLKVVDFLDVDMKSVDQHGNILDILIGKKALMVYLDDFVIRAGDEIYTMTKQEFQRHFEVKI